MAEKLFVLDTEMVQVADAIRAKTGTTDLILWPQGYIDAVEAMSSDGGLNFNVVGGTVQPENPKENTIWVNTSTPIGSWTYSSVKPTSLENGDVWLAYDEMLSLPIDVIDNNNLFVYINGVKQYIDGALVDRTAKVYKNSEWVEIEFKSKTIFANGVWTDEYVPLANTDITALTTNSTCLNMTGINDNEGSMGFYISPAIDFTNYSNITFLYDADLSHWIKFGVATDTAWNEYQGSDEPAYYKTSEKSITNRTFNLDVSNVNGEYFIEVCSWGELNVNIYSIVLTRKEE